MTGSSEARVARRLVMLAVSVSALVVPAAPAAAASWSVGVNTDQGSHCDAEVYADGANTLGLLPAVDFGTAAGCDLEVAQILVSAALYDGSTVVSSTGVASCLSCTEEAVEGSYIGIARLQPYRAEGGATIHLYVGTGERFLTPVPSGCVVYNDGYSLFCSLSVWY